MEGSTKVLQVLHFHVGEIVVALLQPTVIALTSHSSDSQNTNIESG